MKKEKNEGSQSIARWFMHELQMTCVTTTNFLQMDKSYYDNIIFDDLF